MRFSKVALLSALAHGIFGASTTIQGYPSTLLPVFNEPSSSKPKQNKLRQKKRRLMKRRIGYK
ncbi:hypothetical protein E0H77_12560 [Acinetobacter sp. ANC 4633]|uniref:hypothetical protein n=1 Tax=Acinetobacter sp. ANC 4633 TaxID=2529845 RepID=UPI00103A932A|nr:hypothetical protein [Acinetobacter sp. ANC 4633]TCB23944.1 hypothetical protein E0H77_12560 [Acinetobacter sp. ANC 4633]